MFTELGRLTSTRSYNSPRYHPTEHVQLKHVAVSLCSVPLRDANQSHGFVLVARVMGVGEPFVPTSAHLTSRLLSSPRPCSVRNATPPLTQPFI